MMSLVQEKSSYITRTTTWNLPGPSGTRDCINIVSFDKCSLRFSINFMMEGSLNVDSFGKSLLFSINFTTECSLLSNRS